eukprot:550752-Rhodomonas_salina.1
MNPKPKTVMDFSRGGHLDFEVPVRAHFELHLDPRLQLERPCKVNDERAQSQRHRNNKVNDTEQHSDSKVNKVNNTATAKSTTQRQQSQQHSDREVNNTATAKSTTQRQRSQQHSNSKVNDTATAPPSKSPQKPTATSSRLTVGFREVVVAGPRQTLCQFRKSHTDVPRKRERAPTSR